MQRFLPPCFCSLAIVALAGCSVSTTTPADLRTEAESYIRTHIASLSPEEPVLGGSFMVTDIQWIDDDTARVHYEDGHIALVGTTEISERDGSISASTISLEQEPQRYRNETYGYAITVPAAYRMHAPSAMAQEIRAEGSGDMSPPAVELRVLTADDDAFASYQDFLENQLLLFCAADGPQGSISCSAVATSEPWNTENGLAGQRLTLTETVTQFSPEGDRSDTHTTPPLFAFALPVPQGYAALVIRSPLGETIATADTTAVQTVAQSVVLLEGTAMQSSAQADENGAGAFCGGIAGIACPQGYRCALDGTFPDAGGTCVHSP